MDTENSSNNNTTNNNSNNDTSKQVPKTELKKSTAALDVDIQAQAERVRKLRETASKTVFAPFFSCFLSSQLFHIFDKNLILL